MPSHHPLTPTRRVIAGSKGLYPRWPFATDTPRSHPSPLLSRPPQHWSRPRGWPDGHMHSSVSHAASGSHTSFRAAARPVATAPLMSYAVGATRRWRQRALAEHGRHRYPRLGALRAAVRNLSRGLVRYCPIDLSCGVAVRGGGVLVVTGNCGWCHMSICATTLSPVCRGTAVRVAGSTTPVPTRRLSWRIRGRSDLGPTGRALRFSSVGEHRTMRYTTVVRRGPTRQEPGEKRRVQCLLASVHRPPRTVASTTIKHGYGKNKKGPGQRIARCLVQMMMVNGCPSRSSHVKVQYRF